MCRTAKGTDKGRCQFGNTSDIFGRLGYLRFITREKTSDENAFMKISELLVLDAKTSKICSNLFFSWESNALQYDRESKKINARLLMLVNSAHFTSIDFI